MRIALALFIIVPIVEMMVLIRVGGVIGTLPTVGLVVLTAAIGLALIKREGMSTLARAQERMRQGEVPARELAEGVCLAIGGALLLTPGFVTDALGFSLLVPGLRQLFFAGLLAKLLRKAPLSSGFSYGDRSTDSPVTENTDRDRRANKGTHTIEGEFTHED